MRSAAIPFAVRVLIASWPDGAPRGAVAVFCLEHSISRASFYRLRRRFQERELAPASRRPHSNPRQTSPEVVALLLRTRASLVEQGWDAGPVSVLERLRRAGTAGLPSRATIARIFRDAGVSALQPRKRPRTSYQRFVHPNPNGCWQIDATQWALADGTIVVIFQVTDDHSRLAVASLVAAGETSAAAVEVLRAGMARHGIPARVLSDNGMALNPSRRGARSLMLDLLDSLGVEAITGRPYKPTTQGKNERSHQTLHRFLRARPPAGGISQLQQLVDAFDEEFNTRRPHQALNGQTPLEAWLATPRATPPTAPIRPQRLLTRTADRQGIVAVAHARYLLGREHARTQIHALLADDSIEFFTEQGTHIRTTPRADRGAFIGNGLPRTRRPSHNP
jgi:transposase InsO family protein